MSSMTNWVPTTLTVALVEKASPDTEPVAAPIAAASVARVEYVPVVMVKVSGLPPAAVQVKVFVVLPIVAGTVGVTVRVE